MTNSRIAAFDALVFPQLVTAGLADPATYTPAGGGTPVACTVLVDRNVTVMRNDASQTYAATVTVMVAEVGSPRRTATFAVGSETYTVDGPPIERDESRQVLPCTVP